MFSMMTFFGGIPIQKNIPLGSAGGGAGCVVAPQLVVYYNKQRHHVIISSLSTGLIVPVTFP